MYKVFVMPNERILFNENVFSYYYMTGFGSVFNVSVLI